MCNCISGGRYQQVSEQFFIRKDMKELLTEKGWGYDHTCGCTPKYDIWLNPNIKNFQMHINPTTFKIKKGGAGGLWQTISTGGQGQFENTYNQLFQ